MNELKALAKKRAASGDYISINELIKKYPDGVTVNGLFLKKTRGGEAVCFKFVEDPDKYFYATGGDLKLTAEDWLDYCESLGEAKPVEITASEMLEKEPVKLKIEKIRTKNGNTYTKVVNVD